MFQESQCQDHFGNARFHVHDQSLANIVSYFEDQCNREPKVKEQKAGRNKEEDTHNYNDDGGELEGHHQPDMFFVDDGGCLNPEQIDPLDDESYESKSNDESVPPLIARGHWKEVKPICWKR